MGIRGAQDEANEDETTRSAVAGERGERGTEQRLLPAFKERLRGADVSERAFTGA